MKTDASGGDSAEDGTNDGLEARLSGRFAIEMDGAERDYPALRSKLEGNVPAPGRSGRGRWPKFALRADGRLPMTLVAPLTMVACEVDLRVGGRYRFVHRAPDGPGTVTCQMAGWRPA